MDLDLCVGFGLLSVVVLGLVRYITLDYYVCLLESSLTNLRFYLH